MNKYVKFGIPIVAILGALAWLAKDGVNETKTYYKTISELQAMGDRAKEQKVRVGGDVEPNSITRENGKTRFVIAQVDGPKPLHLKVVYTGIDPLPDTFKDGSQALADGRMGADGVFNATKIQAKCASKYEQKPELKRPAPAATPTGATI